jgi:hypothetical protein
MLCTLGNVFQNHKFCQGSGLSAGYFPAMAARSGRARLSSYGQDIDIPWLTYPKPAVRGVAW